MKVIIILSILLGTQAHAQSNGESLESLKRKQAELERKLEDAKRVQESLKGFRGELEKLMEMSRKSEEKFGPLFGDQYNQRTVVEMFRDYFASQNKLAFWDVREESIQSYTINPETREVSYKILRNLTNSDEVCSLKIQRTYQAKLACPESNVFLEMKGHNSRHVLGSWRNQPVFEVEPVKPWWKFW